MEKQINKVLDFVIICLIILGMAECIYVIIYFNNAWNKQTGSAVFAFVFLLLALYLKLYKHEK